MLITAEKPSFLMNTLCSSADLGLTVSIQRIHSARSQRCGLKPLVLEGPRDYFSETQMSVCFTDILKTANSLNKIFAL